ncbi:hypothetical protein MRX96_043582 [Rhipicephalus microplus]
MDPIGAAIYSLAHALLPEEMLEVHAKRRHASAACFGLVRRVFGNAWYATMTSKITPVTITENQQKWAFVANDVASVLKKRVVMSSLFMDFIDVSGTIAKINSMETAAANATNLSPPLISGRILESLWRSLEPHNLYMNLLAFRRLHNGTDYLAHGLNEFDDYKWRSQKDIFANSGVLTIPRVALTSSFTCEDRFLNYATLGVVVADAMLRAIGGPFCTTLAGGDSCTENSTNVEALENVKTCIATGVDHFESLVHHNDTDDERSRLLDALVLSTAAFQVALEAGQSALGAKLLSSVSPEMEMRFVTRYCHHLCNQRHSTEGPSNGRSAALWPRLQCNMAVMNSPMFGPLFKCTKKETSISNAMYCFIACRSAHLSLTMTAF